MTNPAPRTQFLDTLGQIAGHLADAQRLAGTLPTTDVLASDAEFGLPHRLGASVGTISEQCSALHILATDLGASVREARAQGQVVKIPLPAATHPTKHGTTGSSGSAELGNPDE